MDQSSFLYQELMKRFLPFILTLISSYCLAQTQTRVVGYLPTWASFTTNSQNVDFSKFTHINISFANPNASGILDEGISDAVLDAFIDNAHNHNVKVLISIGGAGASETIWKALMSSENRGVFINQVMSYLMAHNFDGIDVDLESGAITDDYDEFVAELSVKTQNEGMLMTAAIAMWNGDTVPDQALSAFDFINLMAYDATGPWTASNPGPHSSFQFAEDNLNYWVNTRSIAPEKCVLGVPFYGYDFAKAGQAITFRNIVNLSSNAVNQDKTNEVYYNGKPTIGAKTVLGIENYGGVMIWEITQDAPAPNSLLDTISSTISSKNYTLDHGNEAPFIAINSPKNHQTVLADSMITIEATAFDSDGEIAYAAILIDSDTIQRFYSDGPYSFTLPALDLGEYTIRIFARDTSGIEKVSTYLHFSVEQPKPSVEIVTPTDLSTTMINKALSISISATDTVSNITLVAILLDGDTLKTFATGGSHVFDYTPLTTGFHVMTCYAENMIGGKATSIPVTISVNQEREPFFGDPVSLPGIIETEAYDLGGYKLTYFDTDLENQGGSTFRSDASDIENYAPGKHNIGYIDMGEWMEYSISLTETDTFDIWAHNASMINGGKFKLYVDNEELLTSPTFSATGGWSTFNETKIADQITIESGDHILKIEFTATGFNIDYLRFSSAVSAIYKPVTQLKNVYPNPTTTTLTIDAQEYQNGTFTLYDLTGAIINSTSLKGDSFQVNTAQLQPGIYIGQLESDGQVQSVKIVKE